MKSNPHTPVAPDSGEETLRLIASLPAPSGLEERVYEALRASPGRGRVLAWPGKFRSKVALENNWMRAAAAAAIVFVIVGGGWSVYTRVEPGRNGKVVVIPSRAPDSGGFSGAGAMRVPETLPGPSVTPPTKKAAAPKKDRSIKPAAGQNKATQPARPEVLR